MASRTGAVVSLKNTVCSTKGFFGPISSIVFLSYDYYSEVVREVDLTKKKGLDLKNYLSSSGQISVIRIIRKCSVAKLVIFSLNRLLPSNQEQNGKHGACLDRSRLKFDRLRNTD